LWRYVYRAVDQHRQLIDALLSARRDAVAARRFFIRALRRLKVTPSKVVTDAAPVYPAVLAELLPSTWHHVEQYENNPIEPDHGQLKRWLRPMRGLRTDRTAQVVIAGHAFVENLRPVPTRPQRVVTATARHNHEPPTSQPSQVRSNFLLGSTGRPANGRMAAGHGNPRAPTRPAGEAGTGRDLALLRGCSGHVR
jgi:hypothetical protein